MYLLNLCSRPTCETCEPLAIPDARVFNHSIYRNPRCADSHLILVRDNMTRITLQAEVPESLSGNRLDQAAAGLFPNYSRGRLQNWIKEGCLLVNQQVLRSKDRIYAGDVLTLDAQLEAEETWVAEPKELNIVYEDDDVLVLNKPTNTVVHPAVGNRSGTLLNGL